LIVGLPVVIKHSGTYRLKHNLAYDGENAIIVKANNVCIKSGCGVTILLGPNTTGILANRVKHLKVANGLFTTIEPSTSSTSIGLRLLNCQNVRVNSTTFTNTRFGIYLGNRNVPGDSNVNVSITGVSFSHPSENGRGIFSNRSKQLSVRKSIFTNIGFDALLLAADDSDISVSDCQFLNDPQQFPFCWGLTWQNAPDAPGSPQNLSITNCSFIGYERGITPYSFVPGIPNKNFTLINTQVSNCLSYGLNIRGVSNGLVDNCQIASNETNPDANLVIGNFSGQTFNSAIIVKDSSFVNINTVPGFDNVIVGGPAGNSGLSFINCIFDANCQNVDGVYYPANLHVGFSITLNDPTDSVNDCNVTNCLFTNKPEYQLLLESSANNVTVQGSSFAGAQTANIHLLGASNNQIIESTISSGLLDGISFNSGFTSNDGLEIFYNSTNNILADNTINKNAGNGIILNDKSHNNTIKDNIASNNGGSGFALGSLTNNNIITDNQSTNNAQFGFINNSDNVILNNTSTKNQPNYLGVDYIVTPGSPAIVGGNLAF
jgi:parallel beta-helix repeat protein